MSVQCRDEFGSWAEYDKAIKHELEDMPEIWTEEWPSLPTGGNDEKGEYASRFDEACIPYNWCGKRVNLLGMTARFLNHACIPNAQVTLFPAFRDEDGYTPNSVLCRACRELRCGEEITVAYFTFYGDVAMRQRDIVKIFGFKCACKDCMGPKYQVEMALACIHAYREISQSVETANETPAKALSIFYAILKAYVRAGLVDIRLGELIEQCAYVCALHSDAARAAFFMNIAFSIYRLVQGESVFDTGRAACFLRVITRIPTFGQSTQGQSDREDVALLDDMGEEALRVAFMLDAADDEYLTIQKQLDIIREKRRRQEELEQEMLRNLIQELQLQKDREEKGRRKQEQEASARKTKNKKKKKPKKGGQTGANE